MKKSLSRIPRLHTSTPLRKDELAALSPDQAHYLNRVMRLSVGDQVRVFNGSQGEWLAKIEQISKRGCLVRVNEKLREPQILPDVEYLFAPLKSARLDYLAQKATEMGVAHLRPVFTDHTQVNRVKLERVVANTIEAAEQCNIVAVPQVSAPQKLDHVLDTWSDDRTETRQLVFCDETASRSSPLITLQKLAEKPVALLVGPEGGFSEREHQKLSRLPFVTPISLGPRIMRADTAAVAAMAVLQASIGDWR